ncbi:unnamed protein product [Symbiodinium necroappetens]|uniref:Uncharacterized protein n=1 Tax=Symbiodinium necroappetens TaxID=1628268 RepID=A0A812ZSS6_9DINO|nr:unnamed protein product [Symbiodinium necroappetens]
MPTTSSTCWTCRSVTGRRVCWPSNGGPSWWESRSTSFTKNSCIADLKVKFSGSFRMRILRFMRPGWFSSWERISARRCQSQRPSHPRRRNRKRRKMKTRRTWAQRRKQHRKKMTMKKTKTMKKRIMKTWPKNRKKKMKKRTFSKS